MQLPAFDYTKAKWDWYRRFHNFYGGNDWNANSNPFVLFDTGEFIVRFRELEPGYRRHYKDLNFSIAGTTDAECPTLYHPKTGEKIVKAWLIRDGMQQLLIDHDTNRAVRLDWGKPASVPADLHDKCSVYCAGNGRPPRGGKIKIGRPRALSGDQKAQLDTITSACKMWWEFEENKDAPERTASESQVASFEEVMSWQFATMSHVQRWRVAVLGVYLGYDTEEVSYLVVKPAGQETSDESTVACVK